LPKLLDVIKEKGLTHQEVIDLIEKIGLPEEVSEEKEVPEIEVEETDKPEEPIELYITKLEEEPEPEEDTVEEEITLTQEELDKQIADAVEEKLKATRKVPSKGKIVDKPQANISVVKKNWFEEIA
jgi:hypothetical protein